MARVAERQQHELVARCFEKMCLQLARRRRYTAEKVTASFKYSHKLLTTGLRTLCTFALMRVLDQM